MIRASIKATLVVFALMLVIWFGVRVASALDAHFGRMGPEVFFAVWMFGTLWWVVYRAVRREKE